MESHNYNNKYIVSIVMISGKVNKYYCDKVATNDTGIYLYNQVENEPSEDDLPGYVSYTDEIIGTFTKRNIAGWYIEENQYFCEND